MGRKVTIPYIVCETNKRRYAVRPSDWAGIWDNDGILEDGCNHTAICDDEDTAKMLCELLNHQSEKRLDLISRKDALALFDPDEPNIDPIAVRSRIVHLPNAYDIGRVTDSIRSLTGYEIYKETFDLIIKVVENGG